MIKFVKELKRRVFGAEEKEPEQPTTSGAESPPNAPIQYIADQPISGKSEDRFNRWVFANRIAETIATRVDPSSIVLGLYGPWGDGKTSVLEMMHESLKKYPSTIIVRFNPWHFQNEDLLLRGFFSTLAEAMGRSLPSMKEKAGELLKNYGSVLSLASLTIGGIVQVSPGETAKGFGESMSSVSLDELRVRIEQMLDQAKKRLVILIDDIDRLDRQETHAIFKLVKLSASFRHTSYVLAFDDEVVSAALGERYGEGGAPAGRAFLEKIVQVPLHLPPADINSLRRVALEGVEAALDQAEIALSQQQIDAFMRRFDDALLPRLETPRRAKLYSNALMFALPILKGEVTPVDLMLIEGIRVLYPNLYVAIREHSVLFLQGDSDRRQSAFNGESSRIDDLIENAVGNLSADDRAVIRSRLLEPLFPRIGNSIFGREWERIWEADQKVCSSQYFKRYFTYSVPLGDVPDAQMAAFCETAPAASNSERRELLQAFANVQGLPRVISWLRQRYDSFSPSQASALISTFAVNADLLPRERGMMVLADTRARAGMLISDLLRRHPAGEGRQNEAERAMRIAMPLGFALECLRWIHNGEDRPAERRVLDDEGELVLQAILSSRIEEADNEEALFLAHPKDAPRMYWLWGTATSINHVRDRIQTHFEGDPALVDNFLSCFVGESWGLESGLPQFGDFRRDQYDSVSRIASAQYLNDNLRARYGSDIGAEYDDVTEAPNHSLRIAHQFTWLHSAVLAEQQSASVVVEGEADSNGEG